jgi:hypothetical protein
LDREQPAQYDTRAIEAYTDSVPAFALPLLDDSLVETDPESPAFDLEKFLLKVEQEN